MCVVATLGVRDVLQVPDQEAVAKLAKIEKALRRDIIQELRDLTEFEEQLKSSLFKTQVTTKISFGVKI